VNSSSPRIRAAIAAFGRSRHDLIEAIQAEHPGRAVIRKGRAYIVTTGRGGSPTLVVAPVVRLKHPKPAPLVPE
jgi:hypothetical protein